MNEDTHVRPNIDGHAAEIQATFGELGRFIAPEQARRLATLWDRKYEEVFTRLAADARRQAHQAAEEALALVTQWILSEEEPETEEDNSRLGGGIFPETRHTDSTQIVVHAPKKPEPLLDLDEDIYRAVSNEALDAFQNGNLERAINLMTDSLDERFADRIAVVKDLFEKQSQVDELWKIEEKSIAAEMRLNSLLKSIDSRRVNIVSSWNRQ